MSPSRTVLLALLTTSCASSPPATQVAASADTADAAEVRPAPVAPPAVCLKGQDDFASLPWTELGADALSFCIAGETPECFELDLASGAFSPRPPRPVPEPVGSGREGISLVQEPVGQPASSWPSAGPAEVLAAKKGRFPLCHPDTGKCHDVAFSGRTPTTWSMNAEKTLAAFTAPVADPSSDPSAEVEVFVFDVASGKRRARHVLKDGSLKCGASRLIGDRLLVTVDVCAGPGGQAWFMDAVTGRDRVMVGGEGPFGGYEAAALLRDDGTVLVLEQTGTRFAEHDAKTGAYLRTIELFPGDPDFEPEPYGNRLFALPDGRLLIAWAGGAAGHFLLVGRDLMTRTPMTLPRCAP